MKFKLYISVCLYPKLHFFVFICKSVFKVYLLIITTGSLSKVRGNWHVAKDSRPCYMLVPTKTLTLIGDPLKQTIKVYCLVYEWSNDLMNIVCVCPVSCSCFENQTNSFGKTKKGKLRNLKIISQPHITFYASFVRKLLIFSFSSGIKNIILLHF